MKHWRNKVSKSKVAGVFLDFESGGFWAEEQYSIKNEYIIGIKYSTKNNAQIFCILQKEPLSVVEKRSIFAAKYTTVVS